MKRFLRQLNFAILVVTICALVYSHTGYSAQNETYYTRINMWNEPGKKIMSTNYHKGLMIPAGTEVTVLKRGKKIQFIDKTTGVEHTLKLVKDYTALTQEEFFSRYFSKDNVLTNPQYAAFNDEERKNIKNGTLQKGMSKAAVLIAYGYPPTHRTPSTENNMWTFWTSRLLTDDIHFENDRISRIVK